MLYEEQPDDREEIERENQIGKRRLVRKLKVIEDMNAS